jgi:hypothetical protein
MAIAKFTIDLDARLANLQQGLDKAGRLAEQQSARMARAFDGARTAALAVGGALGGLFTLGAAAAFVRQTGEAADAIVNLARVSGTSGAEFQRYAFAARTVGIEQEKLSDILKDVQDKVGDFLQTGAGPLADFFEKIAPRVGVTAEQFRKLGGADALQLYVSSLEKANLSQSELTFYLEAIASDSALLLPLLRDNGRAMGELGDKAERLGVVMNDKALAAAQQFNTNLKELQISAGAAAREIAGPLIQSLNDLFAIRERGQRGGGGFFSGLFEQFGEDFKRARLQATEEQITQQRPGFERAQQVLAFQPDSIRAKATVAEFRELEAAARAYRQELQDIANANAPKSNVQGGRGTIIPPLAVGAGPGTAPAGGRGGRAARAPGRSSDRDAIADAEESFAALFARYQERNQEALDRNDEAQAREAQAAREDIERAARASYEATRTPLERLNAELARQQQLLDVLGPGYRDTYERAVFAAQDALDATTEVTESLKEADNFAKELGLTFTSAFEDAIVEGKGLREVLAGLEQDIIRIITRKLVTEPLADGLTSLIKGALGDLGSLFGGGGGGGASAGIGSFLGSLFGGFFADGGYLPPGKWGIAGERGPEPIFGGRTGMTIQPNGGGGISVVNNFTLPAGGITRETQQQIAAKTARAVERASRRNN